MTEDNKQQNIADELCRAKQALDAARALADLGLAADAASRAYYAAYHFLRALLLVRGLEPKTHAGAIHLFNQEFVRTGQVGSSFNRLLSGLQRTRELADYDSAFHYSAEDARRDAEDAERFGDAVKKCLRSLGFEVID